MEKDRLEEEFEKLKNKTLDELRQSFKEKSGCNLPDPELVDGAISALIDCVGDFQDRLKELFDLYQDIYRLTCTSVILGVYAPVLDMKNNAAAVVIGNSCKKCFHNLEEKMRE